jgi:hypothetical protein
MKISKRVMLNLVIRSREELVTIIADCLERIKEIGELKKK